MKTLWQLLSVNLWIACLCWQVSAQTVIFTENFDQLPLGPPVDEESGITQAFTLEPPENWQVDSADVPGVSSQSVGVTEWEGWWFANKNFWLEVSRDERRSEFKRGEGIVAVADPDEWNDLGDPANNVGFFNTFPTLPRAITPAGGWIDVSTIGHAAPKSIKRTPTDGRRDLLSPDEYIFALPPPTFKLFVAL